MEAIKQRAAEAGRHGLASMVARLAEACEAARERADLMEAVVENFPGGISLFDRSLRMVLCNRRLKEMLDYPDALFADGLPSLEDLFRFNASRGEYGSGDPENQVAVRVERLRERRAHVYERVRPNGRVLEIRGVPLPGGGFVTTYFDVTEQHRARALIAHMAHHDGLTDLPNRVFFARRLAEALAAADPATGRVAVHYLDLDGFKKVNDTLGHKAGDDLLKEVAGRLRDCAGDAGLVARLGGDEFAVVQPAVADEAPAVRLAQSVLDAFRRPFAASEKGLAVGVSIGIALAGSGGCDVDDVLLRADAALYRSKAGGRGRFTVAA